MSFSIRDHLFVVTAVCSFYSFDQLKKKSHCPCAVTFFVCKKLRYDTQNWSQKLLLNGDEQNVLYADIAYIFVSMSVFATVFLRKSNLNFSFKKCVCCWCSMFMWANLHLCFVCHHPFHSVLTINCLMCASFALLLVFVADSSKFHVIASDDFRALSIPPSMNIISRYAFNLFVIF